MVWWWVGPTELYNQVCVSSCVFGTPWCRTLAFPSTWNGILELGTLCKDRCGLRRIVGPSIHNQENHIWPMLADAIAKCVDGIMGVVISPKCAHLAGFSAPMGGDSMLSCLEQIGFKPSGGRCVHSLITSGFVCTTMQTAGPNNPPGRLGARHTPVGGFTNSPPVLTAPGA